jgi:hypothetical protein
MNFSLANIGKIYVIDEVLVGIPCENCATCLRLKLLRGEKIHLRDHKLGIWIVDILTHNNNVAYTLALRDDEAERVCLL